ncbi:extracellular solute-binding protein [Niameybacter massiliensis]|uniref:Extracellular solute-binding protein n=1 Tax=Holtiella tumoricola TaxID=3018743 RepID=A0AA42DQ38_9FIRM|nr:extracellular solute-binding protein [Holtiella tumoricola]MDA3732666.1 extracellular solute-binding protein [Holtiella tumoricola]
MKKRNIALFCGLFLLASQLTGCNQTTSVQPEKEELKVEQTQDTTQKEDIKEEQEIKISVTDFPKETDPERYALAKKQLDEYHAKYPNITLEPTDWAYDINSFLPKAASGQLPTMYGTWFTEVNKIVDAGYAADITDIVKEWGYDKYLDPNMLEVLSKDGRIYGLPIGGYSVGVMYNTDLFKQAGLVDDGGNALIPQNFEEMAQFAQTITEKTGVPGFFFPTKSNQGGWMFTTLAWNFGAEFETFEDGKWKAVFNSPEAVQALQYIKDLRWKYNVLPDNLLVDYGDFFKYFGTGQVGMAFSTLDWLNNPVVDYKMDKDLVGMFGLPVGPAGEEGRGVLMGGTVRMFSPNATPEEIDAVFKYLEITGYTPNADPEVEKTLQETVQADLAIDKIVGPYGLSPWGSGPRREAEIKILTENANVDMSKFENYLTHGMTDLRPEEPIATQELYKLLDSVVQTVLTDEKADPQKLLDQAVAEFQANYLDKQQ